VVQIDESLVACPKHTRGHWVLGVPQRWILGALAPRRMMHFWWKCRARRDAATLLPIIQRWVMPGSTVWTDEWAAYSQLTAQTGLAHATVNQLVIVTFVTPGTAVTTNAIDYF